MLIHIFKYEWLTLVKNRVFLTVFSFSMLLCILALWSGYREYHKQNSVVQQIQETERAYYDKLSVELADIEQNGWTGSSWSNPADPTSLALGIGARYAYRKPHFMQIINGGQSDLHPYYYKITGTKHQAFFHHAEIKNGMLNFIGRYDLSFVIIFLLPLLIIAFSFDILGKEKEGGTLPYLYASQWSLATVFLCKYLFRSLVFFMGVWLVSTVCLGCSLQSMNFLVTWPFLIWSLLVFGYMSFWFCLTFFVSSMGISANYTASTAVVVWLMAVVLLPGILEYITEASYPLPSRSGLIVQSRDAGVEAQKKAADILKEYVEEHPELAANHEDLNMNDFGTRYFTVLNEVEASMKPSADDFGRRLEQRDHFIKSLSIISPALLSQEIMNEISANTNFHYRFLEADANAIKKELREFYLKKIIQGQVLKSNEIPYLPGLVHSEIYYQSDLSWLFRNTMIIWGLCLLFLILGIGRYRSMTSSEFSKILAGK
ncbi:ABC transporter permease subunit [Anditalea andensis]|uniref:ABC transporter permease n=1 Tax=Anditalea andensis TaxID=1048983 RepID=A0A074LDP5_9BACT|nr:ABC transporter permease subunit [Anditalea andensis]KEO71917.1 hypothetical protein EL17_20590 [Anditalea andensis]